MTNATPVETAPHLLPLRRVAREIGISRDTILRHPGEFFPVLKIANKGFVAGAAYAAWLAALAARCPAADAEADANRHMPSAGDLVAPDSHVVEVSINTVAKILVNAGEACVASRD